MTPTTQNTINKDRILDSDVTRFRIVHVVVADFAAREGVALVVEVKI